VGITNEGQDEKEDANSNIKRSLQPHRIFASRAFSDHYVGSTKFDEAGSV